MELQEVLNHFDGVVHNGGEQYSALCSAHEDRNASLCISGNDKKILIYCQAGCTTETVVHSAGLEMKDLFLKPLQKEEKPTFEAEYLYTSTLKKIKMRKQDGKKFYSWKHRKAINGKWEKGTNSQFIPLYNELVLTTVFGETVYIVEGEKDVDTLTKYGIIAVCSPHGAGKGNKWCKEYTDKFKGFNIAIIQDNDDIGKEFTKMVANELVNVANTVKIIDLTFEWVNLKKHGDITDVFDTVNDSEKVLLILDTLTTTATEITEKSEVPIQESKNKIIAPAWFYYDERTNKPSINEQLFIKMFVEENKVKCINNILYTVDGIMNDLKAKSIMTKSIIDFIPNNHADRVRKLLAAVKSYCYIEQPEPNESKIHFLNGALSLNKQNMTYSLWSNEKEFCVNRISTKYNPNAKASEKFLKYLSELFYEDDIITVQQFCGYFLIPTNRMQLMLCIIGTGGEGKSVLGNVLQSIIGDRNCYKEKIHELQKRFGVANLEHKLIMIDDDLNTAALKETGIIKSIVTNTGIMECEKKGVQNNECHIYSRLICFGNSTLQSLYDNSDGFLRRPLAIQVKPKDKTRKDNRRLFDELLEEKEGIINWFLQGLNELVKNNFDIYISERTNEISENLKRENDTVTIFMEECENIEFSPNVRCHSNILYSEYEKFCKDNALVCITVTSFSNTLKQRAHKYNIDKKDQIRFNGKKARGYTGVSIKDISHHYYYTS